MSKNKGDLINKEQIISLKKVLSDLKELRDAAKKEPNDPYMVMIMAMADTLITHFEKFPMVDAQPVVHGRWIRLQHSGEIVCSNCGRRLRKNGGNDYADFESFCPNCGAKMDGGDTHA